MSRRNGAIRSFHFNGKLGRDTPVTADLRRGQGREVIYLETNDAGALLRFTDTYSKVVGGQLQLALDPPTSDSGPKEGLLNVRDFTVKGEASLDKLAAGGTPGAAGGISFTRLRAEFVRQSGQLTIKEGVLKGPEHWRHDRRQHRLSWQSGAHERHLRSGVRAEQPSQSMCRSSDCSSAAAMRGVFGLTYEVVGTPDKPTLNVNPLSPLLPGITRKIMDFNTGKQNGGAEFPAN